MINYKVQPSEDGKNIELSVPKLMAPQEFIKYAEDMNKCAEAMKGNKFKYEGGNLITFRDTFEYLGRLIEMRGDEIEAMDCISFEDSSAREYFEKFDNKKEYKINNTIYKNEFGFRGTRGGREITREKDGEFVCFESTINVVNIDEHWFSYNRRIQYKMETDSKKIVVHTFNNIDFLDEDSYSIKSEIKDQIIRQLRYYVSCEKKSLLIAQTKNPETVEAFKGLFGGTGSFQIEDYNLTALKALGEKASEK